MLVKDHVICANTIQVCNSRDTKKVKKKVSPVSLKMMAWKVVVHPDSVITKQPTRRWVQV